MKKLLVVYVVLLILCTGCSKLSLPSKQDISTDLKKRITSSEELCPPIDIEKKMLMDKNGCKVYVPWINNEKYSSVNIKIESFITDRIDKVMNMGWDEKFFINFDYVVSYNQNEILSFYFLEDSFIGWRSHEFLTGINIDMQSGKLIPITDLIAVNEIFLDKLFSDRSEKNDRKEHISNYLINNYDKNEILEIIKNETGVNYYFSKDCIYVSFSLPQALAFHMEFDVNWNEC